MSLSSIEKELKQHWIEDIEYNSDIKCLEEYSKLYISILNNLKALQNIRQSLDTNNSQNDINKKEPSRSINDYIFHRRLKGGIGVKSEESEEIVELIPEKIVREQELETGDTVKIEKYVNGSRHRFTKQHHFNKIPINEGEYQIKEYNNAIVSFDNNLNEYIIKSYSSEDGIKPLPRLLINKEDVQHFKLKEGDIIDCASMAHRNIVKVRWSYNTSVPTYNKPNKSSFYKDNTDVESHSDIIESNIKNKNIFMVGGDNNVNRFTEEIKKRGGTLITTQSNRETMITNLIDNSDIVVIPVFQTSHIKMHIAKSYCNKTNTPYLILEKDGRSHFIKELENIIYDSNNNQ